MIGSNRNTDPREHPNSGAQRIRDIVRAPAQIEIEIDGKMVPAHEGESVLAVLFATGKKAISRNDHGLVYGAWCSMGVCFSCLVEINGRKKQRACQALVQPGMQVRTRSSYFQDPDKPRTLTILGSREPSLKKEDQK